jgi:hypothetical protein
MDTSNIGMFDYVTVDAYLREEEMRSPQKELRMNATTFPPLDAETLRRYAWEIGEENAAETYVPADNHVGLVAVTPNQGFAHWRIQQQWVED